MSISLPSGPLVIDIEGFELSALERERLMHPLVGGLILFSRNYASREQLTQLCAEVHALRLPPLLIALDHEGGRVQRCRAGFTRLPAMRSLGRLWEKNAEAARQAAREIGFVLAAELRACGVDLSFTPVLDLDWGRSQVIGERAFHGHPETVIQLAGALIEGLADAGMAACGKHFPGHGWAEADSHHAIPFDERSRSEMAPDLLPYQRLNLSAVMPAHVIYPQIDALSAGFSPIWQRILREDLAFDGVVFSDDLSMQGAGSAGGALERVEAAWQAGCDLLLLCNSPAAVAEVLEKWHPSVDENQCKRQQRMARLLPKALSVAQLSSWFADPRYLSGVRACAELNLSS